MRSISKQTDWLSCPIRKKSHHNPKRSNFSNVNKQLTQLVIKQLAKVKFNDRSFYFPCLCIAWVCSSSLLSNTHVYIEIRKLRKHDYLRVVCQLLNTFDQFSFAFFSFGEHEAHDDFFKWFSRKMQTDLFKKKPNLFFCSFSLREGKIWHQKCPNWWKKTTK